MRKVTVADCTVEGCGRPVKVRSRGLCGLHFERLRLHGSVEDRQTPEQRFWRTVEIMVDGCWNWTGRPTSAGYGKLSVNERPVYAHRFSYELLIGPIPEGLDIDHLCRNTMCVRPDHLEPVTRAENIRRGMAAVAVDWRTKKAARP